MISKRLRDLIEPNVKLHMQERDWKYIDEMFSEVYLTNFEGIERVSLKPHPEAGNISMQFSTLTGSFIEITPWDYIQSKGELL